MFYFQQNANLENCKKIDFEQSIYQHRHTQNYSIIYQMKGKGIRLLSIIFRIFNKLGMYHLFCISYRLLHTYIIQLMHSMTFMETNE